MEIKLYSQTQREAVYDWIDKWFELSVLIVDVTSTDEPPYSAPLPTDLNEINYQRLRLWLRDHEEQFAPLWHDFYRCQDWAIKDDDEENDDSLKNLFSYLYAPENLYQLAKELELQSGTDVWEPSKPRANIANGFAIHAGKKLVEFLDWLDGKINNLNIDNCLVARPVFLDPKVPCFSFQFSISRVASFMPYALILGPFFASSFFCRACVQLKISIRKSSHFNPCTHVQLLPRIHVFPSVPSFVGKSAHRHGFVGTIRSR